MTSFTSEQILLRKKSSLDGVHPLQAIQMDGVSPLQKLVTGSSPHLMLHSHHLRHNKQLLPTTFLEVHHLLQVVLNEAE